MRAFDSSHAQEGEFVNISQELFDQLLQLRRENNHFMRMAGIQIDAAEEGKAQLSVDVTKDHLNPQGTAQGGLLMTMVDAAMASTLIAFNETIATVDMNYHFLSAAHLGDHVVCDAWIVKSGKNVIVTQGVLHIGEKLIGNASATFMRTGRTFIVEGAEDSNH